jgi:hypothetical protein
VSPGNSTEGVVTRPVSLLSKQNLGFCTNLYVLLPGSYRVAPYGCCMRTVQSRPW